MSLIITFKPPVQLQAFQLVSSLAHHVPIVGVSGPRVHSQVSTSGTSVTLPALLTPSRLLAFAGNTLLVYDYLLTLPLEVRSVSRVQTATD